MCLIAMSGQVIWSIFLAALGLGLLIFIHELGHFAVAKWCGVKCEKFYLGFDIFGISLVKFRWGETVYGIGLLPLGGYVKMLGQDDNPNRAAEERRRARQSATAPAASVAEPAPIDDGYVLDPRSFMAQSVLRRMAIISAGVIMNMVLAFVLAVIAYLIGVMESPCQLSGTAPGEPAWQADLRPGDEIVEINGRHLDRPLIYSDLREAVMVGRIEEGVRFNVVRDGKDPFEVTIKPRLIDQSDRLVPTIGVLGPISTKLAPEGEIPVLENTPAAAAGKFQPEDTIVAVGSTLIRQPHELLGIFARGADRTLQLTVERKAETDRPAKREEITVAPRPMRDLGLSMRPGAITAVQANSPAAKAGLAPGDTIDTIDGRSLAEWNVMRLDGQLRRKARGGEPIEIVVERQGKTDKITMTVEPRDPPWSDEVFDIRSPAAVSSLGVTIGVTNSIALVEADGPAAKAVVKKEDKATKNASLAPGDVVEKVQFENADKEAAKNDQYKGSLREIKLTGDDAAHWPLVIERLQNLPTGTVVRLVLAGGRTAEIAPANATDWYNPDRGFRFQPEFIMLKAEALGEAVTLGGKKTRDSALIVYSYLRALSTGQVSTKSLGGIGSIATGAAITAQGGFTKYLMFLVAISANLAVINMLPIPVLDGGHMVFLIWEAVRGKPPSEKALVGLTWLGAILILFLILYSNGLDVVRLFSWLFD